jgi:hypothetical protein
MATRRERIQVVAAQKFHSLCKSRRTPGALRDMLKPVYNVNSFNFHFSAPLKILIFK